MTKNLTVSQGSTKLRRPTYEFNGNKMHVTYFNGTQWKKAIFSKDDYFNKMAQDITKFISENALKNNGKISSGDMLSAWIQTKSLNYQNEDIDYAFDTANIQRILINKEKIDMLDGIIQQACQENSDGGTNVTQKEQFSIMNALANFFTKKPGKKC